MSLTAFIGSMELGLVYSLLAFGTFISYRILRVADLTVDGSFVLGAAASAMLTLEGMPFAGILAAMAAGAIAGVITALLQTKMGIQPILAGILTMTGLYSINLMVMGGKANIPLLNNTNIFTVYDNWGYDKKMTIPPSPRKSSNSAHCKHTTLLRLLPRLQFPF
jgi:putative ABC transport system permease protein